MSAPTFTAERRPGTIRMILVDPWARTIAEGWQDTGLDAIKHTLSGPGFPVESPFPIDPAQWGELEREHVPCYTIDIRCVGRDFHNRAVDLIIDDEGRLKGHMACFRLGDDALFAGRALFASSDHEGETVSTPLELFQVRRLLSWAPWDTDYTPPSPTIYVAEPGEDWGAFVARVQRESLADGL